MSFDVQWNGRAVTQLSQDRLESIVSQADVTSAQVDVGEMRDNPTIDTVATIDTQPNGHNIYVTNPDSNTVSVINSITNAVIKNINVGDWPIFILAPPFGHNIYVANYDSNTVSVINSTTNAVIKNINVGGYPSFIDAPPFGRNIYVANSGSNTVSVINSTTNAVIKNINVGDWPIFILAPPFGRNIYVANSGSNTVSVINSITNAVIKNITVGGYPSFIDTYEDPLDEDPTTDNIYVANSDSNTVSVINSTTNAVIKNITVGYDPSFILAPPFGRNIYVANSGSNTVSVINSTTNAVIKNITVGYIPNFIYTYEYTIYEDSIFTYKDPAFDIDIDNIYVANSGSNTVSVINSTTNAVIKNITVGDGPSFIDAPTSGDPIYVSNSDSNTVSVIDSTTSDVVAGVTFDIIPFGGGQIICNGLDAPISRHFYVASGTACAAKPNSGYEFESWVQIFDDNSTRTINASTTSGSPWTSFLDIFGIKSSEPAANLTVSKFGNFSAYFRALPPPVPAEFTLSLITVIVATLVGSLLIPAAMGWVKSKKQTSRLNSFHQQMALVYDDGKVDENDLDRLDKLNKDISNSYAAGKITNDQYTNLKNEVSAAYQKFFKKRIESITDPSTEAVNNIKNNIKDAYSDRKITELDYDLLIEKISDMLNQE